MTSAGHEHGPFARRRHVLIALAASIAYVLVYLCLTADRGILGILRPFGHHGDWTAEVATLALSVRFLLVAFAAWLALVAFDTHSGVTFWPRTWKPLLTPAPILMISALLIWKIAIILNPSDDRLAAAKRNYRMMLTSEGLDWSWYLTFMTAGVVMEELLFRVLLQRAFEGYMSPRRAIFVQAGVFLLAHAYLYGYGLGISQAFAGLVYGVVFMRTRSLMAPTLVHWLANVTLAAILTTGVPPT